MEKSPEFLTDAAAMGRPLRGLDFSGMILRGLKLDGLRLTNCSLDGADLTGASLRGAVFCDVYASRVNFTAACLDGSEFRNVVARHSILKDTSMIGIDWVNGSVEYAFVLNADARESRWSGTATTGAAWAGTSLAFADLRGLENGQDLARWYACGTGGPEDRAALALFNHRLNTLSRAEARKEVEGWRHRLNGIRPGDVLDAEEAASIRMELAAVYRLCTEENRAAQGSRYDHF